MRKYVALGLAALLAVTGVTACSGGDAASAPPAQGAGGAGRGGGGRPPMPVEFAAVTRGVVSERVTIVGNLIGAATVEAVPRVNGRLQAVHVKLGDSVRRGQALAKVEDREIREQVNQAEAAFKVSAATIRQREADLKLAQTNLERNQTLLERQLLPRQTYDDTEARHQAAVAQLDLARAQYEQSKSRLDELKINLANTIIASPVDGFVGKRYLDPGASVSPNVPVASIVDIRTVRMVANVVEKDVKRLTVGMPANVEVDAFPGEKFVGRLARVAPVFDPQTRTAEMEIEVPNRAYRLKPGMYARVDLTVESRDNALTVPSTAVVDVQGKTGVFVATNGPQQAGNPPVEGAAPGSPAPGGQTQPPAGQTQAPAGPTQAPAGQTQAPAGQTMTARFLPVQVGIRQGEQVEITSGLTDGAQVITTGATALKDGDRIVASNQAPGSGRGQGPSQGGQAPRGGSR